MGGEQAANVLLTVKLDQLKRENQTMSADEQREFTRPTLEKYELESSLLLLVGAAVGRWRNRSRRDAQRWRSGSRPRLTQASRRRHFGVFRM